MRKNIDLLVLQDILRSKESRQWHIYWLMLGVIFLTTGCKKNNPVADFTVNPETVNLGDTVYFINNSSNASFYQWSFGDGDVAITKDASHVFPDVGTYTVTLVAIGDDKSNTATKEVEVTGEIKIFEGQGIDEFDIYDTWLSIRNKLSVKDTVHYVDYDEGYYYHTIYYYNKGIALGFINFDGTAVSDDDNVYEILVMDPYEGYTTNKITFGDGIAKIKAAYGTPSDLYSDSYYNYYYYYSDGVEFWISPSSSETEIIGVYSPLDVSNTSTGISKSKNGMVLKRISNKNINKILKHIN